MSPSSGVVKCRADDPFTKALRGTYNDLDTEKAVALGAIAQLDAADDHEPAPPGSADIALLDALPFLALNLADAPDTLLRKLFEITQLTVRLDDSDGDHITITIRLPADQLPHIAETAERITDTMITQETPVQTAGAACVDAVRAPGQSRTDTGRILSGFT